MEPTNPYQAPQAAVTTARSIDDLAVRPARRVRASRGGAWLNYGFASLGQGIVGWTLVFILLTVGYVGALLLGELLETVHYLLGFLPTLLLYPFIIVIWGGVMLGCHSGPLTLRKVMDGAQTHFASLMRLGVIGSLISLLTMIPLAANGALDPAFAENPDVLGFDSGFWLALLASLVLTGLILAGMWFSPALVAIGGVSPWVAIKRSFGASMRNVIPFTVFSLLVIVLAIAALLLIVLLYAVVAGVVGFSTSFNGPGSGVSLTDIIFGVVFYMGVAFMIVCVTGGAQYASFQDIFAYDETT